ncbi:protein PHLOEM PROTEIN 2-LIKE A1-like isoform X1 [Fagus crenata]
MRLFIFLWQLFKYFVDKKSNKNGFMLFARGLEIEWAYNPDHWKWNQEKDASGEDIEVAELIKVSLLELKGDVWTIDLSLGTQYEIVFVVKIIGGNISSFSVKLNINCPNFEFEERHESLEGKPLNEWFEIQVGEFIMSPKMVGHLKFSLHATDQSWKAGLVVKCAIIRPKN